MKTKFLIVIAFLIPCLAKANFILGQPEDKWGLNISPNASLKMRIGTRLQTEAAQQFKNDKITDSTSESQDFYVRRARLQVEALYQDRYRFYMDIRNDDSNKGDLGDGDFNLGDAYIETKNPWNTEGLIFRAFRAKVDVSRTQTIGSADLNFLDRPFVADEAAQFVNQARRASNIQLLGQFDKWYFQTVIGDGVQKDTFSDAKGQTLSNGAIDGQKFMAGAKLRVSPFDNWEDKKPSETYFGQGQHFSIGAGLFHTPDIEYRNSTLTQIDKVSRTLLNGEASFHYQEFSMIAEYFHFDGVIEDLSLAQKNEGTSEGYYVAAEYVLPKLYYLAPYFRFESWNRFKEKEDFSRDSTVAGINWYLQGNSIRVGLFYQNDQLDKNLQTTDARGRILESQQQVKITSMWHF